MAPLTDRHYMGHMMNALVYRGPSRIKKAWLGALACYHYMRAHDGTVVSDEGDTISFSRWYCFTSAFELGWRWLWRKDL